MDVARAAWRRAGQDAMCLPERVAGDDAEHQLRGPDRSPDDRAEADPAWRVEPEEQVEQSGGPQQRWREPLLLADAGWKGGAADLVEPGDDGDEREDEQERAGAVACP